MESELLLEVAKLKKMCLAMPKAKVLADIFSSLEKNNKSTLSLEEKILFKANGEISSEQREQLQKRSCGYVRELLLLSDAIAELESIIDFCIINDQEKTVAEEVGVDTARCRKELITLFNEKNSDYCAFLESLDGKFEYPQETEKLQKRIENTLDAIELKLDKLREQANTVLNPRLARYLKEKH